ncbi:MAG: SPOR domain-containing protein [Tannerellaceae bacterium]|nr:SPOR domain-containing protein [Tannerellaceae bacterium]
MHRIISHIERLLLAHDCIIVPKLGGFVLQTVPAIYREEDHLFVPSRKEVLFNTTLSHDDGLLTGSYMQEYGVSFRNAALMVEEDVCQLKEALKYKKKVVLGKIGSFSTGEEGQLIFSSKEDTWLAMDTYGFPEFHFPLLPLEEKVSVLPCPEEKKDIIYIPVNRKFVRGIAASAAAILLFFLISTPIEDVNQASYTASFVPAEIVNTKVSNEIKAGVESFSLTVSSTLADAIRPAEPVAEKVAEPVQGIAPATDMSAVRKKMYHVVIASFPTESQAAQFISGVDRQVYSNVNLILRDGRYRVYADRFDNREEAEMYMASVREHDRYKDAWLFISR